MFRISRPSAGPVLAMLCALAIGCDGQLAECSLDDDCAGAAVCVDGRCGAPDPCDDGACAVCMTGDEPGCNGCPAGVRVPDGWVCIPPGEAFIGQRSPTECAPAEACDETRDLERGHRVRFSRPIMMQSTEVTIGEWLALMGTQPSTFAACGPACPVHTVAFDEMLAYANAMSERDGLEPCYVLEGCRGAPGDRDAERFTCEGRQFIGPHCLGYRLPTEAEWEYAARAGTQTATPAGDLVVGEDGHAAVLDPIAWHPGNAVIDYPAPLPFGPDNDPSDCGGAPEVRCGPQPVATCAANAWGLHDMLGNVMEHVWDWYSPNYGGFADPAEAVEDPVGPSTGLRRIFRGGAYNSRPGRLRSAFRVGRVPDGTISSFGFRLVRSLPLGVRDCRDRACPVGTDCVDGACTAQPADPLPMPTRCADGDDAPPCNECGAVDVPEGFVCAPAGAFTMGRQAHEICEAPLCGELPADEAPHPVRITRPFAVAAHEVTGREWFEVMGNLPSNAGLCGGDCPVHTTTWLDAIAYVNALSRREGLPECHSLVDCTGAPGMCNTGEGLSCERIEFAGLDCPGYRLPTEAEWEYAARAGTVETTWAGPLEANTGRALVDAIAWYADNTAVDYPVPASLVCGDRPCGPQPVGLKAPNPWGLYDTVGNAAEWVWDVYSAGYGGADPAVSDPLGPSRADLPPLGHPRTWRGGGWSDEIEALRSASRIRPGGFEAEANESGCWGITGIRPVRTLNVR